MAAMTGTHIAEYKVKDPSATKSMAEADQNACRSYINHINISTFIPKLMLQFAHLKIFSTWITT